MNKYLDLKLSSTKVQTQKSHKHLLAVRPEISMSDLLALLGTSLVRIDFCHGQESFRLNGLILLDLGICQPQQEPTGPKVMTSMLQSNTRN